MGRCASSVALATTAAAVLGGEALAEEYLCRFDETIRRVELRVDDPQERLPCQVVYWKDTEEPDRPRVLWHATTESGFCERKAQELVQELERGGWSCRQTDGGESTEARARPDDAAEPPVPDAASNGRTEASEATADREALREVLQEAIARDVARLDELTTRGGFDAQIAALGDLDGDGNDDAAVIMTYTDGAARSQYLVAYMFRGSTYLPAARVAISDREQGVRGAEVEAIEDGAIRVQWQLEEPGEAGSGPSRAAFVVQNGKLVEIPTS